MPHALITGGSRRLGLYLTEHLLAEGWHITVLSRSSSPELDRLSSDRLKLVTLDYYQLDEVKAFCQQCADQPLDLLIHNASLFVNDGNTGSSELFSQLFHVHMQLPALLNTELAAALARSDNGNIIHMTDIYAENPNADYALYCATKAGLENLSKSFAKRLAPAVRVNSIQPGALKFLPDHSAASKVQVLKDSLLPHEAGFEPIFQTVQYLLANTFVTGTAIKVDGGRSISRN
ncbi:SDR family NAD(P)-dependent oxidoreductase [Reinekea sp.]|jgi:dihydromonapterin reductase/dihydrofolate reductase|uniref:SDR family NAD(P)-dependent oxidoreductase n=1 Tax=Reinekea sp. TaxID=1970455 RepID=UPI002A83EFA1|nr:SDR family NAD(P)-dependent oxidoreductase [Reinekea sp.]